MRTLMRPGRKGVLVKIERRGATKFVVRGADSSDPETYFELSAAVRSFEALERGIARPQERADHWRIARRAYDSLRTPSLALLSGFRPRRGGPTLAGDRAA